MSVQVLTGDARKTAQAAILRGLLARRAFGAIAAELQLSRGTTRRLAAELGHPDQVMMRGSLRRLTQELGGNAGPAPEDDDPILIAVQMVTAAAHNHDPAGIKRALEGVDRTALIVALASIVAPDTDLALKLEHVDLPPQEWSQQVVDEHAARWDAGARDWTAAAAHEQAGEKPHRKAG